MRDHGTCPILNGAWRSSQGLGIDDSSDSRKSAACVSSKLAGCCARSVRKNALTDVIRDFRESTTLRSKLKLSAAFVSSGSCACAQEGSPPHVRKGLSEGGWWGECDARARLHASIPQMSSEIEFHGTVYSLLTKMRDLQHCWPKHLCLVQDMDVAKVTEFVPSCLTGDATEAR